MDLDLTIPDFLLRKKWTNKMLAVAIAPHESNTTVILPPAPKPTPIEDPILKSAVTGKDFVPNVQRHMRDKAGEYIAELEGKIDDGEIELGWSLYDYLTKHLISNAVAGRIGDHFQPQMDELVEVLSSEDDEDLQYAYRGWTKGEIEERAALYLTMIEDIQKYGSVTKKVFKARAKKKPSVERVIRDVKFMDKDDRYKLASISPAKVVGAQELWTFNVPQMLLTVYRAIDRGGLTFRGSSIINIDEKASFAKRIGRNTEQRLEVVMKGGKIALRKLMDEISGATVKPTRITKQTILLRVL